MTRTIRRVPRSITCSEIRVVPVRSGEDSSISRCPITEVSGFFSSWATVAISWPL